MRAPPRTTAPSPLRPADAAKASAETGHRSGPSQGFCRAPMSAAPDRADLQRWSRACDLSDDRFFTPLGRRPELSGGRADRCRIKEGWPWAIAPLAALRGAPILR